MKIPLNRIVAFAGPYVSLGAGAVVAFIVAKANALGLPGLGDHEHELATGLAAGGVWLLTTGLSHLGQMKWLKGVHIELASEGAITAASLSAVALAGELPEPSAAVIEPTPLHDDEVDAVTAAELPSDEVEFASPPPAPASPPAEEAPPS